MTAFAKHFMWILDLIYFLKGVLWLVFKFASDAVAQFVPFLLGLDFEMMQQRIHFVDTLRLIEWRVKAAVEPTLASLPTSVSHKKK